MQIRQSKYIFLIFFFWLIFTVHGFSQSPITFKAENQPLNSVLNKIAASNKVRFAFDDDYLSIIKVSFDVKKMAVEPLLKMLSVKYPIGYRFIGGTWVVFKLADPKPVIPKWTVKKIEPVPVKIEQPIIPPKPRLYSFFGNVYDAQTGNKLKFTNVLIGNSKCAPGDRSAHFYNQVLSLGSIDIKADRPGYEKIDSIIKLSDNTAIFLWLNPEENILKQVYNNDFRFNTRTVSSADNLVLIDGIEIPDHEYLFGYISNINNLYLHNSFMKSGGYDISYNNGSSGLYDYSANINAFKPRLSVTAGLSDISFTAGFPVSRKVSFSVAARKSLTDLWPNYYFMNIANSQKLSSASAKESWKLNNPSSSFYDVNANISIRPDSLNDITLSFITGYDNSKRYYNLDFTRNYYMNFTDVDRFYGYGLKWNSNPSKRVTHNFAAMFTTNSDYSAIDAGVGISEQELKIASQSEKYSSNSSVLDVSWNTRISGIMLSHEFGADYRMNSLNGNYSFSQLQVGSAPFVNIDTVNVKADKHIVQAFYQAYFSPFSRLSINGGVRGLYDISSGNFLFIPRVSVNASLFDDLKLYFDFGRYVQHLYKAERFGASYNTEYVWYMNQGVKNYLDSYHYTFGAKYRLGGLTASLEGYYKTETGRAVLFPDEVSAGVYRYSIVQGSGVRLGADLALQYYHGIFSHNLKYSFSSSQEKVAGKNSNRLFNSLNHRPHRLKFSEIVNYSGWTAKIDYEFASGSPYISSTSVPYRFDIGASPLFSQLDVEISKQFKLGKCNTEVGVNVLNVLNTKNEVARFNHLIWEENYNTEVARTLEGLPFTVGGRISLSF